MGCGCPVVCENVPAVKDIVVPGRTGTLVPSENVSDLAENIERLLNDRHSVLRMALAARELVYLRFDWRHSVASYNEILDSTMPFQQTLRHSLTSDNLH
jgi:glycosyltransferase involved in cell wall biosynthesis